MQKIKKGDEIIVIAGKDKGMRGEVLQVLHNGKVLVDNINMAKKHQKGNPQSGVQGGIIDIAMPLAMSNVAIYNQVTGNADRVGIRMLDDGRKVRYYKSNGEVIDS